MKQLLLSLAVLSMIAWKPILIPDDVTSIEAMAGAYTNTFHGGNSTGAVVGSGSSSTSEYVSGAGTIEAWPTVAAGGGGFTWTNLASGNLASMLTNSFTIGSYTADAYRGMLFIESTNDIGLKARFNGVATNYSIDRIVDGGTPTDTTNHDKLDIGRGGTGARWESVEFWISNDEGANKLSYWNSVNDGGGQDASMAPNNRLTWGKWSNPEIITDIEIYIFDGVSLFGTNTWWHIDGGYKSQ